jgi:phosphoglycerate kinase
MLSLADTDIQHKRVLIREDLNVPLKERQVVNDERIQRALPTIQYALSQSAAVLICSHLGRPQEGVYDESLSLAPVADALSQSLGQPVRLEKNWLNGVEIQPGEVVLCENVRFNVGEKANDVQLSQKMAALCDVFVMDAFATAHRVQASTVGVIDYAPVACAGPLLASELQALERALGQPEHPVVAIVGGSKVSTKIQLIERLLDSVDTLIVGGGIANTCLLAVGYSVGDSLVEADWVEEAKRLLALAKEKDVNMPLPVDVAVAKEFSEVATRVEKPLADVAVDDYILDVGQQTFECYAELMQSAKVIVWNGPVGVFEFSNFSAGTQALGQAVVSSNAFSLAGGGDTVAAISQFNLKDGISYVSTGGGAFLEWMQGDILPAVSALNKRVSK